LHSSQNDAAVTESSRVEWAISPADRAKYLQMFGAIDKSKKGYLTGNGVESSNVMLTVCICSFAVYVS